MITKFVAGFVLFYNHIAPQVYIHPERFETHEECRVGGESLWIELRKVAGEQDSIIGDCFSVPAEMTEPELKKFFLEKFPQMPPKPAIDAND